MNINELGKINKLVDLYKKLPPAEIYSKTILEIFNRTYNENFISDYLAYILNPFENGIGIEPLQRLLAQKEENKQLISMLDTIDKDDFEIIREYSFDNQRRIDILIKIKKQLVVGIENKIFSSEGYRQTIDYFKSITKETEKNKDDKKIESLPPTLFYLTREKNPPKSPYFMPMSYYELFNLFSKIDLKSISNVRSKIIFNDFLIHIKKNIMTNNSHKLSEKFKLYVKNFQVINDLESSFNDELNNFFEYITERVRLLYQDSGDWEFRFPKGGEFFQIYRRSWYKKKGIDLHFEYWFSKEGILKDQEMQFMVDVEGKNRDIFFKKFEHIYPKIKSKYQQNNIQFRPESRKIAIAYKEYKFKKFSAKFEDEIFKVFKKSYDDFKFLIPYLESIKYDLYLQAKSFNNE